MLKSDFIFSSTGGTTVRLVLFLLLWNYSVVLSSRALLVVDVQNCFIGNGSLAVKDGEKVIPVINSIRRNYGQHFSLVVFTQDWHCVNHVSFASAHPNHKVFETINLTYLSTGELCQGEASRASYTVDCSTRVNKIVLQQRLWPDHCVQDTFDARFHRELTQEDTDVVIHKGQHCQVDSYSGFFDNGNFAQTDLDKTLKERGIQTVFVVGLALDYCVADTAKDARKLGYQTYVVLDATGLIAKSTSEAAKGKMADLGVGLINSSDLNKLLPSAAPGKLEPQFVALISILFLITLL